MDASTDFTILEGALAKAGKALAFPPTPELASRVGAELRAHSTMPAPVISTPRQFFARRLVPIMVAVVVAILLLIAVPNAREAIAQFLGLNGLRIFYVTPTAPPEPTVTPSAILGGAVATPKVAETPTNANTRTPTPTATTVGGAFEQCCETTLAEAQRRARFKILLPPSEQPSRVYYQNVFDNGEQVVLVFGNPDNPKFTLYQAQNWIYGKLVDSNFAKGVDGGTLLQELSVRGERALWLSGAAHLVMRLDENGNPIFGTARTVDANTLAWESGDVDSGMIYRVETKLSLDEAAKFAESLK